MKWPVELMLIRHGESKYNEMKKKKERHPAYVAFRESFEINSTGKKARELASEALKFCALKVGDNGTPLTSLGKDQAIATGQALGDHYGPPHVIFVSPHLRTRDTLAGLMTGWPELAQVRAVEEVRIREQEHGLALLYNDWRIFHTFHPEQAGLSALEGPYWYRYPQGESVPDAQFRIGAWIGTLIREYSGRRVMVVTHHLSILAIRAMIERFGAEEFIRLDDEEKPINCGVTLYKEDPELGAAGKLGRVFYNQKFY